VICKTGSTRGGPEAGLPRVGSIKLSDLALQILVGGSPGFFGGWVSFFFKGVHDFRKQGRFYPSVPLPRKAMNCE